MLRRIVWSGVFSCLLMVACPTIARAQVLADRVPDDTIVYVGWQGVASDVPGYKNSNLQHFLDDSNLPAVMDDFLPKVMDRVAGIDKDAAEAVKIIRVVAGPMWRHPSALAFQGITIDQGPRVKLVLLCQAGDETAALKAKVEDLLKQAAAPFPINLVEKDNLLALVVGYDKPESAIPDAGGKSMATNSEFVKSLKQVSKGAFYTEYVDIEKLLTLADVGCALAGPEVQKNWQKARDLLGLKGVERLIVTEAFDGKDWASEAFVAAPGPRTGLIGSLIDAKPLSKEILRSIPGNATLAGAGHLDLAGLFEAARSGIAAFDADTARQFDGGVDQVNQTLGIDVRKDLLAAFGDEWAYFLDPDVAGELGYTLVNRMKDPAKAQATLEQLEKSVNAFSAEQLKGVGITLRFRQAKIDGVTVHYLGIPLFTPAWTIQDGHWIVGLYPEVVAAAVGQGDGKHKFLGDNKTFSALADRLGEHPVSGFAYIDIARRAPQNYGSWMMVSHLANAGDLFDIPAPTKILPSLNKLLKCLGQAGEITWTEADGMHMRGLTPFPGAEMFATDQSIMSLYEMVMVSGFIRQAAESNASVKPPAGL